MEFSAIKFPAMGGEAQISLYSRRGDTQKIGADARDEITSIERELSRFDPASALTHLNTHVGEWVDVPPVLFENIVAARECSRLTNGLFNPFILESLKAWGYVTRDYSPPQAAPAMQVPDWQGVEIDRPGRVRIPAALDLGGIAKGWTADRIADRLAKDGPCAVSICGDVATRGGFDRNEDWFVRFRDAAAEHARRGVRVRSPMGAATSGTTKRCWAAGGRLAHHIIDPRTAAPAETDVANATVLHRSAVVAECFATAIVILGADTGLKWVQEFSGTAACVTTTSGAFLTSDNFWTFTSVRQPEKTNGE
jgi:FAD:protein FMN transferase